MMFKKQPISTNVFNVNVDLSYFGWISNSLEPKKINWIFPIITSNTYVNKDQLILFQLKLHHILAVYMASSVQTVYRTQFDFVLNSHHWWINIRTLLIALWY